MLSYLSQSCTFYTMILSFLWGYSVDEKFNSQIKTEQEVYDFIIVGAGSAGCVVANRLTEIKDWKVLLLEAGGEEPIITDIPRFAENLSNSHINWNYKIQFTADDYTNDGISFVKGKVMGGTSSINWMIYIRGNSEDYNEWERLGNNGWSYDKVLPYFKKSENNRDKKLVEKNPGYHGTGGYLTVESYPYPTKVKKLVEKSFQELGYKAKDVMFGQQTTNNRLRQSTNGAFIRPIRGRRKNLFIKSSSYVTKILIDPKTKKATGIEYTDLKSGKRKLIKAKKEVIISGGVINSPQLLMVSGIGPRKELKKHNIKVIKNLSVGKNLQDHVAFVDVATEIKTSTDSDCDTNLRNLFDYFMSRTGPFSLTYHSMISAYVKTEYVKNKNLPDIQLSFRKFSDNGISIVPTLLIPESRGFIKLNKTDPVWGKPLVYPRFLDKKSDINRLISGARIAVSLLNTTAMKNNGFRINQTPLKPCQMLKFNSKDYWECFIINNFDSFQHAVGTCKMGPKEDKEAVVDSRLRVFGIESLRVIDASIMPIIPRANTNAPTIMIAEKGSDMIKEDWSRKIALYDYIMKI